MRFVEGQGQVKHLVLVLGLQQFYQPLLLRAAEKQIQLLWLTKYGLNYANM